MQYNYYATPLEEERNAYYLKQAIETQRKIVNFKSSTTNTSESLIWTYRTTACDVISVITTTVPVKNGMMKDIKMEKNKITRFKPATKLHTTLTKGGPYDIETMADNSGKRKQMNSILRNERQNFMTRLNISRNLRSKIENDAVTKIQALYRGHFVRINFGEIEEYNMINNSIRSNLKSFLANKYGIIITLSKYKKTRINIRNQSALLIQSTFLKYLSRRCLRRKQYQKFINQRRNAVIKLQAALRGASARSRVKLLVERIRIVVTVRSALKIQTAFRGMLARQVVRRRRLKLRHLACQIIQEWYRTKYSRKMAGYVKKLMYEKKKRKGAVLMQVLIRRFLAYRRLNRIRLRRLHKIITLYVGRIQAMIRGFLARCRVISIRESYYENIQSEAEEEEKKREQEENVRIAKENEKLLESVDIMIQAKKGDTKKVENLLKNDLEKSCISEVDEDGNSVLLIAAQTGNLALVEYCLYYGFDINHRNKANMNALMLATKANNMPVVRLLLDLLISENFAEDLDSSSIEETSKSGKEPTIIDKPNAVLKEPTSTDLGFLMVAAAANSAVSGLSMLKLFLKKGFDVNARHKETGMTALHASCEVGHVDAFKYLVKRKSNMESEDDFGQLPLHKAASASPEIVQLILGLDPSFNTYMSELMRGISILKTDRDGKDSFLLAALHGMNKVLDILESVMTNSPAKAARRQPSGQSVGSDRATSSIQWSQSDLQKVLKLVENGNLLCLTRVIEFGLNCSFSEEVTGNTMAIVACKSGNLDMIDLLLAFGADFSIADKNGKNALHHAAEFKNSALVAHLLTHQYAAKCKINAKLLLVVDHNGDNVFHIAARGNVLLNIDLLASSVLSEVFETKNKQGMTPLMVACSFLHCPIIMSYLRLEANGAAIDKEGHDCMWHCFHPDPSVLEKRRPICTEFVIQTTKPVQNRRGSTNTAALVKERKERDVEAQRLTEEINVIKGLLATGCTFYPEIYRSPEEMKEIQKMTKGSNDVDYLKKLNSGDVAVKELCLTLFSQLTSVINQNDLWMFLISSVWLDDGSFKVLSVLIETGIIHRLTGTGVPPPSPEKETIVSRRSFESLGSLSEVNSTKSSRSTTILPSVDAIFSPKTNGIATHYAKEITADLSPFSQVFYGDMTILGWIIRLGQTRAFKLFVERGYNCMKNIDLNGNNALHYTARYGLPDMIDMIILTNKKLQLEKMNNSRETAGMIAAKYNNFHVAKRMFQFKVNPRRSLDGNFAGWVLAFARMYEKQEKNLQTGRYGDDDETYFTVYPDPIYSVWYNPSLI